MRFEFARDIFGKKLGYQILSKSVTGGRVVPCGGTDRRTDVTKLIVAFRNFANAPRNTYICKSLLRSVQDTLTVTLKTAEYRLPCRDAVNEQPRRHAVSLVCYLTTPSFDVII